jgi:hypothetical protein
MQQISISIWRSPPAPALAGCLCLSAYAQPTKTSRRDSPAKPQPTAARQPIELRVGMTPDQWTYKEGTVEFIEHKGTKALKLNAQSGVVILKDMVLERFMHTVIRLNKIGTPRLPSIIQYR